MKKIDIFLTIKPLRTTVVAIILFVFGSGVLLSQTIISGNVFEDMNYSGGAGRSKTNSSGVGIQYADIELYDSSGVYMRGTNTDASGNYSFTDVSAGTYYVRVVTDSVRSSRTGWSTSCKPVLTYRTNSASGTAVAVTDFVGGTNPSANDPGVGSAGATFNTTTFMYSTVLSGTAQAVTQCIITSNDITGVDFGFNYNAIVNTNNSGQGSLRQAITNMNTLGNDASLAQNALVAAKDNAVFMISNGTSAAGLRSANNYFSSGVATITPTSSLTTISSLILIDAQKQPGWTSTPVIRVTGESAGASADGFLFDGTSDGSTLCGFMITNFSDDGIDIQTNADNITIAGNWIGTTGTGSTGTGNFDMGIQLSGQTATIGGTNALDVNVITNNGNDGISINGSGTTSHIIQGNYIGLDPDGSAGEGNTDVGIGIITGSGNIIGGTITGARNLISQNYEGIEINTENNVVQGNYIGTDFTGTLNRGNKSDDGIEIRSNATGNTIGGTVSGAGNLIAFNYLAGVNIISGTSNAVLGNDIYSNSGLGIDIGSSGVLLNNGMKNSELPNYDMDNPVFTSAILSGTTLTYAGYVGSVPNQSIFANSIVEIFKSDNDASGYGEGKIYLGRDTCDLNGNFSGSITFAGISVGDKITGTATDSSNNTSEFGANYEISGTYYSKGSFTVDTPSNWNTKRDGTGTDAVSFATDNIFVIQNTHAMTLAGSSTWDVSATGTVQIESGGSWSNSSSGTVTMENLQVDNGGTYSISGNATIPGTKVSLGVASTVEYSGTDQTVLSLDYGNLTLSGSGTKTLAAGTVGIGGDLDVRDLAVVDALTYNDTVKYFGTNKTVRYGFINKNLKISDDCAVTSNTDISAINSLVINSGGTLNMNGYALDIDGTIINNGNFVSTNPAGSMSFYSKSSGDFNSLDSWSNSGYSGPAAIRLPGDVNNDVLIIGDNKTINLTSSISNLGTVRVDSSGALNPDSYVISGLGQFDLRKGGTLKITSPNGIDSASGSIQTATQHYDASANFEFSGASPQVTGKEFPSSTNNLTIINHSGVTLSNSARLNGNLSLTQGNLILRDNNLTLSSASSIIGTPSSTNMIVASGTGQLIKEFTLADSFTFPVGDDSGSVEYSPITLNFISGDFSSAYAGVNVVNTKHPQDSSASHFINRYWTVSSGGITDFSCDVTCNYTDQDIQPGADETKIYAKQYKQSGWILFSSADTSLNILSVLVSGFGDVTGGENPELTNINITKDQIPNSFAVYQNYPNPFNPSTKIRYAIPSVSSNESRSFVTIKVYDILGTEVLTLVNEEQSSGIYEVEFNGSNLSSGVYIYKIQVYPANGGAGNFSETKKMQLTK